MPPPLRYPSYRPRIPLFHSPPWLRFFALTLFAAFLCTLSACPEPPPSEKTDEPIAEASIEKTAPPKESMTPEEAVTPEDGGLEREPEQAPEDPNAIAITSINGTGSELPIAYGNQPRPPNPREASKRFQDSWNVEGKNLDRIQEWQLRNQQTNQSFTLTSDNKGSDMISLKLPQNLVAGLFLLVGLIGGQTVVQAQTFVLQGEKGEKGEKGDQGDAAGLSQAEAALLKTLLAKIKLNTNGNNIEITSDEIAFKTTSFSIQGDTNQTSFTLDDTARTATFSRTNVRIQNGSNQTTNNNSLGNLIIGYNENGATQKARTGSHNLILGIEHSYTEYGSIISGQGHTIDANHASAIGGRNNTIKDVGAYAVAIAGELNNLGDTSDSKYAAAVAGQNNTVSSTHAAAVAGQNNRASGSHAATVGGGRTYKDVNNADVREGNDAAQISSVIIGGYKTTINTLAPVALSACSSFNITLNASVKNGCCQQIP